MLYLEWQSTAFRIKSKFLSDSIFNCISCNSPHTYWTLVFSRLQNFVLVCFVLVWNRHNLALPMGGCGLRPMSLPQRGLLWPTRIKWFSLATLFHQIVFFVRFNKLCCPSSGPAAKCILLVCALISLLSVWSWVASLLLLSACSKSHSSFLQKASLPSLSSEGW